MDDDDDGTDRAKVALGAISRARRSSNVRVWVDDGRFISFGVGLFPML